MAVKASKFQTKKDDTSTSTEKSNFTEVDRQKLSKIYDSVANLTREVSKLQRSLKKSNQTIEQVNHHLVPPPFGKDVGTGNWIVMSSPDDLFRHDIDVDFAKLDYKPMLINNTERDHSESVSSSSSKDSDDLFACCL